MKIKGRQWTSALATVLLLFLIFALLIITLAALRSPVEPVGAIDIVFIVLLLAFPLVGWLMALRLPHNPLGWIFLIFPVFLALGVLSEELGLRTAREGDDSAAALLLIVGGWLQFLGYWLLIGPAILLFPDGKVPGNRFRWALGGSAALLLVWALIYAIGRDTVCVARFEASIIPCTDSIENSLSLIAGTNLDEALNALVLIFFVFTLGISVTAVVLRYFRSTGDTRQQIKWVAFMAAAGLLTNVGLLIFQDLLGLIDSAWIELLAFLPILVGLPVAVGVAMFKYRLYDIDRIISRTAAYALIVLVLVAVYVVSVTLIQRLLPIQNQLGIVISTLVVAALFSPLRRRVQNAVDRRFNRSKYDADRVLGEFSRQLRDDVDLEQMQVALLRAAQETMQPSHLSLWVRERGR